MSVSASPATATATSAPPPRTAATEAAWSALHAATTAPYQRHGRFAWHFARGKLGRDPVFRGLLEHGLLPPDAHLVDIGSGQSLLASLQHQIDQLVARQGWPAEWPPAPVRGRYTGIELMPRDVERARAALADLPSAPQLVCADMCQQALPPCQVVVILDVLHYVDHAAQAALLARVHAALTPGGRLLLRVGDAAARRGFAISQWVDRLVTLVRGHRVPPTFGRNLAEWQALLHGLGFAVRALPMSQGTPFANVLLVADKVANKAASKAANSAAGGAAA
ncbi:methyltransferase [Aquabacterium sp. OR-4]|uniref:methyltransferase n=1 Tax=Aquabacterium sp. OR-4 TaxID=2978127 RepID=UPI0021B47B28|nr:class I SAM-dependent methyltransferase [Aquabacterium sp. OR-4]MDT7836745.1 class I SAM-dependent methyltransferase [Aquabacterium sp. OR-4]